MIAGGYLNYSIAGLQIMNLQSIAEENQHDL